MCWVRDHDGGDKECMQSFCGETLVKRSFGRMRRRCGETGTSAGSYQMVGFHIIGIEPLNSTASVLVKHKVVLWYQCKQTMARKM
jgi:hypothetical protein